MGNTLLMQCYPILSVLLTPSFPKCNQEKESTGWYSDNEVTYLRQPVSSQRNKAHFRYEELIRKVLGRWIWRGGHEETQRWTKAEILSSSKVEGIKRGNGLTRSRELGTPAWVSIAEATGSIRDCLVWSETTEEMSIKAERRGEISWLLPLFCPSIAQHSLPLPELEGKELWEM